jgi:hypothetical protein
VKVYKLVRRAPDGKLLSAYMDVPGLQIEYRPGEWVQAKLGPLFSFEDRAEAERLIESDHELWEAEAEEVNPYVEYCVPSMAHGSDRVFREYCKLMSAPARVWRSLPNGREVCLPGTVLSRRLRLVRKVGT